ncbi:helix-turn-helix domain-containing protein [Acidipila sp. EB88]|uniref:helix-turn-helix domain-containing protein n=1 Tax=Acidipila sp. EB88 TaxID=2305226 RepID=UPI0013153F85|nr:helix-turn-helix domain-containing protein [Acidipila sp. EB88]
MHTIPVSPEPAVIEFLFAQADPALFEPLISAKDVAESFHIKERTVLRWAREGKIPGYKCGKFWRFRSSDLNHALLLTVDSFSSQSARVNQEVK